MAVLEKDVRAARSPLRFATKADPLAGAFFWLSAFYAVYCVRPEDWIPGLSYIPLAKIAGVFALVALLMSAGRSQRRFRDLPREAGYFVAMIGLLFISALLSPVWKGGAFFKTLDFSKALVAWVLTFIVITNFARLRRIIFIQSASVAVIAVVSVIKGRSSARLEGVVGGIYSNPNDLAFAIVLTLPFCFAFLLSTRSIPRKIAWAASMLVMCLALFLTASRAGFIDLLVTGAVCLWIFGIRGKRLHLVAAGLVVALVVGFAAGGKLKDRFFAISGNDLETENDVSAHGSYEQRRILIADSIKAIAHYPLGIGMDNFGNYSGTWREVHVSYLQIAAEGGIGALVLYLLFFARGFGNLRRLRQLPSDDAEVELFSGALYGSLIGFVVGAFFAPEAYEYFPYFAVAYTSVLLAMAKEKEPSDAPAPELTDQHPRWWNRRVRTGGFTSERRADAMNRPATSSRSLRNR
jgi:putative inorganic carbon (hco3(-)) transporter